MSILKSLSVSLLTVIVFSFTALANENSVEQTPNTLNEFTQDELAFIEEVERQIVVTNMLNGRHIDLEYKNSINKYVVDEYTKIKQQFEEENSKIDLNFIFRRIYYGNTYKLYLSKVEEKSIEYYVDDIIRIASFHNNNVEFNRDSLISESIVTLAYLKQNSNVHEGNNYIDWFYAEHIVYSSFMFLYPQSALSQKPDNPFVYREFANLHYSQ